jgi:hypothetical protein
LKHLGLYALHLAVVHFQIPEDRVTSATLGNRVSSRRYYGRTKKKRQQEESSHGGYASTIGYARRRISFRWIEQIPDSTVALDLNLSGLNGGSEMAINLIGHACGQKVPSHGAVPFRKA